MSRKIEVDVFKFSELSDEAKQRAKIDHESACGYSWSEEAMDSIKALAAHFGGRMSDWEVDWSNSSYSSATFDMPEMSAKDIRKLLGELGSFNRKTLKGKGDCKLTGFCMDEDAIDGFRIAFRKGERDLNALMQSAFDSWLNAAQSDYEWQFADEQFAEMCDANGYEFYESGKLA